MTRDSLRKTLRESTGAIAVRVLLPWLRQNNPPGRFRLTRRANQPVGRVLFNPPLHARWRVKENPPYELTRGLTTPPAVSSLGGLRMPAPVCAAPPSWGRHPQTFSFATGSRQQKIRPCRLCPESENHFRTAAQMTENGLRCLMSEDGGLRTPRCLACRALRITANLSSRFNVICPTGKSDFPVQPFSKKFSTLLVGQIISTSSRHPVPRRGASAIVTNVGTGCGGRDSVGRETKSQGGFPVSGYSSRRRPALKRTAKPCGPGTRCWC